MKKSGIISLVALALLASGIGSIARAQEEKPAVIEGEMVDMKCWVAMDMPGGGKHLKCAMDCAKQGIPAGVVDSRTGQVFTMLAPAPGLAEYMGKTVRVTGDLAAKSTAIIPEKIEVKEGDEWKEAKLPEGMM